MVEEFSELFSTYILGEENTNTVSVTTDRGRNTRGPSMDYPHERNHTALVECQLGPLVENVHTIFPLRVLKEASLSRIPQDPFYTNRSECLSRGSLGGLNTQSLSLSVLSSLPAAGFFSSFTRSRPPSLVTSSLACSWVSLYSINTKGRKRG